MKPDDRGTVSLLAPLRTESAATGRLATEPWPHLVVDNFLGEEVLARSLAEIGCDTYNFDIEPRGTGRIEFSLLRSETLWRAIYSRQTIVLLAKAFGVDVKLDRGNMVQLRRMNEDTPEFPVHNDFTASEDSIASFLYLSSGWSESCGGRLRLFESEKKEAPSASIEPRQNRFVAFQTKPCYWHSVERVHGWERLSALALWNLKEQARS
jgi:hypothetical protein